MSKNTYTLTPQNQLIDLNGDLVNFDLTFTAISKDGTPFKAVVIDQQTLDTNPELQHNIAENGSIGGNIVYDKNVPQNLFLILKIHEKPCEVEVLSKSAISQELRSTIIRKASLLEKESKNKKK